MLLGGEVRWVLRCCGAVVLWCCGLWFGVVCKFTSREVEDEVSVLRR